MLKKIILILLIFSSSVVADEKMALGLEVFNNKAKCSACHTLKAAQSSGSVGPNLDAIKPLEQQVRVAVRQGRGAIMPNFGGVLSDEEIEAVAYFVYKGTRSKKK